MNEIDTGPLNKDNLWQQFCSEWLKQEIAKLFVEIDQLRAENQKLLKEYSQHTDTLNRAWKAESELLAERACKEAPANKLCRHEWTKLCYDQYNTYGCTICGRVSKDRV